MLIIAIIAGALLGGAWGEGFFGAVTGAVLAWLLVRSAQQQKAIAELRRQLGALPEGAVAPVAAPVAAASGIEATGTQAAGTEATGTEAPGPDIPPASEADGTAATPGTTASLPPLSEPAAASATPASPTPLATNAPATAPPRDLLAPVKAWLFGGNTIVKLGVAILFVGLAFLARFASEHVHLPIELRLAAIGAAAVALLAFGWRLRLHRPGYAQVLQGAAVAALFLTLFVAFRTYQVMPALAAFALMVAVAGLAAALAVLQDARSLAVIGALGGFATPLLVSTGSGNHVALFAYYLALDLGIAAVAWFKHWRALNLIGFVATFGVGSVWGVLDYRPERYASSQAFLIVFFLLFVAIGLLPARRAAQPADGTEGADGADRTDSEPMPTGTSHRAAAWVNGSLLFGLPTITFALQLGMVRHFAFGSALSALVLAAFYVGLALWLRRRGSALALVFEASLAIAVVFLTLVIPFALDARSTAGAWALEGAGLVWLGWRQQRRLARVFGYLLIALAGPTLLWALERQGAPQAVLNGHLFNGLMAVAGSLLAAHFVRRGADAGRAMPGEGLAQPLLVAWATLLALWTAGLQIDEFVQRPYGLAAWLVAGSVIALVGTALAVRFDWTAPAWPAALQTPLLALGTLDALWALRQPLAEGGFWAWPVALATQAAVLRWAAPRWPARLRGMAHGLGVLVLATLGALGARALTAEAGDAQSAWAWLAWLAAPAGLLMGLLAALRHPAWATRWPLAAAPGAYGLWAAGLLALSLALWTLLANALSNGAARPLPHVPLLNPLDLGVGVALCGVWLWLRSPPAREAFGAQRWLAPAVMGLTGFVWLNAILIRAFHHYGGVPYRLHAWANSLPVHTGITLLWTASALVLMWLAARRALRAPWAVGAVLLAAVVVKLVLVDLSGSGTVARIVSFIGVGVLMLVIGYVAPLPAAREASDGKA